LVSDNEVQAGNHGPDPFSCSCRARPDQSTSRIAQREAPESTASILGNGGNRGIMMDMLVETDMSVGDAIFNIDFPRLFNPQLAIFLG
jgi:hypothetical protein